MGKGIIFNAGKDWKEMRRFTLKTLKDFGFAKASMQDAIIDECDYLIDYFETVGANRTEICLDYIFNRAALNVVWKIIAGERYQYSNKNLKKLLRIMETFMHIGRTMQASPMAIFPVLRHFPPFKDEYNKVAKEIKDAKSFLKDIIQEHKDTFEKEVTRDYIDTFLNQMNESSSKTFSEENLLMNCLDLFLGGSETTSKSLMFFVAHLILYPDLQEKIYQEISAEVAGGRVRLEDIPQLPFSISFMMEVWRYRPIIAIDPPRKAIKDITIKGFNIPSGTEVWSNYYAASTDEEIWKNPLNFEPDRHIGNQDNLLTFGVGRRKCLGESLARMENSLFFCNLVKNFKFECSSTEKPSIDFEDIMPSASLGPKPFKVIVTKRV